MALAYSSGDAFRFCESARFCELRRVFPPISWRGGVVFLERWTGNRTDMAFVTDSREMRLRLPWGLAGMVLMVILVEGFIARRPLDFLDPDDWAYREARRAAAKEATRAEVLCFGDSLVKFGVMPRVLAEASGKSTWNLAVSGSQAWASAELLQRSIDSGARPSAVVVDFFPPLLRLGPRHNLRRWSALLGPRGAAALAWSAGDASLFGSIVTSGVLPSLRARDSVRAQILARLSDGPNPRRWANMVIRRNWTRNLGAQPMADVGAIARMTEGEADEVARSFFGVFECHPGNSAGVERFLAIAAGRGIPVYWLLPPVAPVVRSRVEASGFAARHRAFVERFRQRYPNVRVVDALGAFQAPSAFLDAQHLAAPGALAFSQALGELLHDAPNSPVAEPSGWLTWGNLAPAATRASGLEDLEQSRLAVDAMGGRARR